MLTKIRAQTRLLGLFIFIAPLTAFALDDDGLCGSLSNHYGPFDYRTESVAGKKLVENAHFTPKVESLIGGNTSISAGGDMNYTLKVFPNHHRALMAVIKLGEKEKTIKPRGMEYSVACWFDRAERFRPDDGMVKAIHGIYLIRSGKPNEAVTKLEEAIELAGDNPNILYNLGLAYFDLKLYDKALENAHRAYAAGFPLSGLKNKLKRAGKWQDPNPTKASGTVEKENPIKE